MEPVKKPRKKNKNMINLKKKKKQAFSLAEVMIALVIVAILMAASAPLVNRRASIDNNFSCYWKNATNGIYFNDQGTGQVGIGTEARNQLQVLHLFSEKTNSPQIAFYRDKNSDVVNVLGIYNDNIHIGPSGDINSANNIVIGKVSDTNLLSDGDKLIIGGMNSTYPILYGKFNQNLPSQKLRVNGQLQVQTTTTTNEQELGYSLVVDERGIYSAGNITANSYKCGDKYATHVEITDSSIILHQTETDSVASIDNNGTITGTSLVLGGYGISSSGDITGTSLIIGNYGISSNGDIAGTSLMIGNDAKITLEGIIEGTSFGSILESEIKKLAATSLSDIRLKNVIGNVAYGLEAIRKIEIKEYKFKDEKKYGQGVRYGVIAQEIQKILPKTVLKNKDGFLTIRTNDIFFVAINAIKELDKEVQTLKNRNKELENEIQLLKKQNQNLEKKLSKIEKHLKLD